MSTFESFGPDPVNSDSASPDFLSNNSFNLPPEEAPFAGEKSEPLNRQSFDKYAQNGQPKSGDPFLAELTSIIRRKTANLKLRHRIAIERLVLQHEQALAERDHQLRYSRAEITALSRQIIDLNQQLAELKQKATEGLRLATEPGILSHISTTYQVERSQSSRFNRSMNAFQQFLLYVVTGLSVAGLSAIALSYTTLWPAVLTVIRPVIPFVFVAALVGLVVIFLWELAQSQSHNS
ncbi:MAG: hypothetical protein WA949_18665 [Phormidesmis sp.]